MTKKKESINNEEVIELGEKEKLTEILSECYEVAEVECKKENIDDLIVDIGEEDSKVIIELANTKHACRGAALTLAIYKILHPEQDIRSHKAEYENGFSARGVDHSVTVPFLIQKGLPYNVDTHWLSQTLSYSQPYMPDVVLKTVPKKVGPDFIITVNLIQNSVSTERVKKITILILEKMIEERNKGNIPLTKPKNLSIDQVMEILHKQFSVNYEKNAPRLPQIAVSISCQGVDIWKDTKRIAQWMYEHEEKRIDEFNLLSIVKTGTDYLTTMIQLGFLGYYESESIRYFYFLIDSLTDFLVARSLFDDIRGKIFDEQVDIIKSKIRNLYNLEEAVIIAIFDNLSPNYEYIKKLLVSTGLMERLQYDTLVKIKFKKDSIQDFLTVFSPAKPDELLGVMGGYTDKPFNCTNYLRNYYFENECKQTELSVILSGHHFLGGIKGRLKNILYFITLNNRSDRRDDEAYYFAILCCSAPNKDVRCLAMKLLYEIVSSRTVFKKRLIEEYKIFTDFYIKEAIIFVLSKVKYNDVDIVKFFEKLIKEERNLSAKSIKRIAEYFGDEYGYIRWNRENLYDFKQDAIISDFMDDLLLTVDLMNKEFLPFRYWGKDHIDMHTKFLKNDKHIIGDINNYLEQKYQCVRTGDCNGSVAFERRIMAEISPKADIETLDMNSFFESYEVIIKKLFNHYQVTNKKTERHMREEDFHDSVYMKCVDIATGLYYGSLMCNYYTNQFATYNNNQNKKRNHVG